MVSQFFLQDTRVSHDEVGDDCSRQVTSGRLALANLTPALPIGGQARTLSAAWRPVHPWHVPCGTVSAPNPAQPWKRVPYLAWPAAEESTLPSLPPLLSLARHFLTRPAASSTTSKLPIPAAGDMRSGGCRFRSAHTQVGPAYLFAASIIQDFQSHKPPVTAFLYCELLHTEHWHLIPVDGSARLALAHGSLEAPIRTTWLLAPHWWLTSRPFVQFAGRPEAMRHALVLAQLHTVACHRLLCAPILLPFAKAQA